ncbi:RNA polymerase sigma factor [bacterium]|nr:MAG: RNA polymerase sigma factor [bacterium]
MGTHQETQEQIDVPAGGLDHRGIFEAFHGRVHRFFKSRGFGEDEALDLTQETFVRVFQSMDELRSRASLDSWILKIAANVWKNEIRFKKAGKRDAREVSLDGGGTEGEGAEVADFAREDAPGPLEELLTAERQGALDKCLDALPPRMRRCLVLHVYQERKYQEIADLLEISIQSVKSHIHQAKEKLGECVARRLAGGTP